MDKHTEKAWHNWVVFTRFATWSVIAVAALVAMLFPLFY